MVFAGQLFITSEYEEEKNVIVEWYDSEYHSLLIIDKLNRIERYKEMRDNLDCSVRWLTNNSSPDYNDKTIFINNVFDDMTQEFTIKYTPVVAFFRE